MGKFVAKKPGKECRKELAKAHNADITSTDLLGSKICKGCCEHKWAEQLWSLRAWQSRWASFEPGEQIFHFESIKLAYTKVEH